MRKEKTIKICIIALIVTLAIVVVITSIILYQKRKKLDELEAEKKKIESKLPVEGTNNKIILKNLIIFIDKE